MFCYVGVNGFSILKTVSKPWNMLITCFCYGRLKHHLFSCNFSLCFYV